MLPIKKQWVAAALCASVSTASLFAQTPATSQDDADSSCNFIKKVALPHKQLAVVSSGRLEPCSIGSFVVAIYSTANTTAQYETDDYSFGLLSKRDGAIEGVTMENLGVNAARALVVKTRSAGSGGYVSAYAFVVEKNKVRPVASVEALKPKEDYLAALRQKIKGN